MNTSISNSVFTAVAFALTVGLSGSAMAGPASETATPGAAAQASTISISYASAELATEQGRATLYRQIRRAAEQVCGPRGLREAGSLALMSRNRQCYEEAVSAAVSQVGSGQMAAMLE